MPHTRTRTGCWTCRDSGYKCDEQKPSCGRCTRLNIDCKGYGPRFKWKQVEPSTSAGQSRQKRRSKSKSSSPTLIEGSITVVADSLASRSHQEIGNRSGSTVSFEQFTLALPSPPSWNDLPSDLDAADQRLLHYWTTKLSSLISTSSWPEQANPFQIHLTSMVVEPGALRSTVMSMAARHLAIVTGDESLQLVACKHQQLAIHHLRQLLQNPVEGSSEMGLAAILMMLVSSRLFAETDDWSRASSHHLHGARAMITHQMSRSSSFFSSPTARFLMSLLAYHDILSSVSRGTKPLLEYTGKFSAIEDIASLHRITTVLHIVARISQLQELNRSTSQSVPPGYVSGNCAAMESMLNGLGPLPSSETSGYQGHESEIEDTVQAYRHAAFIYLYRVWLDTGAPHPATLEHVQECLSFIARVPVESPLVSAHVWPLFTAGCESIMPSQRAFVWERLQKMYESRHFPSILTVQSDVEDVWRRKDNEQATTGFDGMSKIDCIQVILRERGREVNFA